MRWAPLLLMACGQPPTSPPSTPGTVTLHRLNRAEYDNTVRDLFGTSLRPAAAVFPVDDFGYGFDNNADVLTLSPLHLEMYQLAADQLVDELFGWGTVPESSVVLQAEADMVATGGAIHDVEAWILWSEGSLSGSIYVDVGGTWQIAVVASGQQGGDELVAMEVRVDGVPLGVFDVEDGEYVVEIPLDAGAHGVSVHYLNDWEDPPEDRNLIVDSVVATGPIGLEREPSPSSDMVLACASEVEARCAEQIVARFGRRAFRRPLSDAEFAAKMSLYGVSRNLGGSWEEGVGAALSGILMSPSFVFRVERDRQSGPHALHPYELATRLSYFLWSSTPDEELLDRAADGSLGDLDVLEAQARRMLADPRSAALVDNFGGQLFYTRAVRETSPSTEGFPDWDVGLRASMEDEMRLLVRDVLRSDEPMTQIFTADWTWVDARLARHYGLEPPVGLGFERISLEGTGRRGLLTTAGLLTALSHPNETSPVKRGKWVLDNVMCTSPPPPPADIADSFPDIDPTGLTKREVMELHRADPTCASCHAWMDPIGFTLENFDPVGRWREIDEAGHPIDASVELPDGASFSGADDLAAYLAGSTRVRSCLVNKLFTYALGRGVVSTDQRYLDELEWRFTDARYRFDELAVAIALSEPFRMRSAQ